jgi:hypothetical protein
LEDEIQAINYCLDSINEEGSITIPENSDRNFSRLVRKFKNFEEKALMNLLVSNKDLLSIEKHVVSGGKIENTSPAYINLFLMYPSLLLSLN